MSTTIVVGSARAIFTISLLAAAAEEVRVGWITQDGTALAGRDYEANSGTVTFLPGEVSKQIEVFVHGRTIDTEDRMFYVSLTPPVNAVLADNLGACIIRVDTTGSEPVVTVIIPKGEKGEQGDDAYQVALSDGFVGTKTEWLASLRPSAAEIAPLVAPLINAGSMSVVASGTESLTPRDMDTVAGFAGRIAYMGRTKKAIAAALTAGVNVIPIASFAGEAVDPLDATGFNVVAFRAGKIESLAWEYLPGSAEIRITNGQAGDVPIAVQQDIGVGDLSKTSVTVGAQTNQLTTWIAGILSAQAAAAATDTAMAATIDKQALAGSNVVVPEQFVPQGTTVTDWAPYIRLALATGSKVQGKPGKQYPIGSRIDLPSNCDVDFKTNGSSILMLTGAGFFDRADRAQMFGAQSLGFLASGVVNVTVKARIFMQANAAVRTCSAIAVRSVVNPQLDIYATDFKEAYLPIVAVDSITGGHIKARVENCNPNGTIWTVQEGIQVTAVGIDSSRVSNLNSTAYTFDVHVKNVLLGPDARAKYTEQTDALNIQTTGYSGARGSVYADSVGEACDIFGDNCIIDVVAVKVWNYAVKFVHGASYNLIHLTAQGTGGDAVVFGGSNNTDAKDCFSNRVYGTVRDVGGVANAHFDAKNRSVVATDGSSATFRPRRNYVELSVDGGGPRMTHLAYIDSGQENTFVVDGSGFSVQAGVITATAGAGNQIRRTRPTSLRYAMSETQALASGALIPFSDSIFDALGEFDTGNRRFVCRCAGRYRVKAQIRAAAVPASGYLGLITKVGANERARHAFYNTNSAGTSEGFVQVESIEQLAAGDIVTVSLLSSAALSITSGVSFSYLEITQL